MHRSSLSHRDIKPHNVLVRRHRSGTAPSASSNGALKTSGDPLESEAEPLQAQMLDEQNRSSFHAVLMVLPFSSYASVTNRRDSICPAGITSWEICR